MHRHLATALVLTTSVLAGSASYAQTEAPAGELTKIAAPTAYRLDMTVDPAKERFSGHTEIDMTLTQATDRLFLHGLGLDMHAVSAVAADGSIVGASYEQVRNTGVAKLRFARELPAGAYRLVFDYDAPFRVGAEGLYHVRVGDQWYAWTQMEPFDARRMFPGFDEPRHKTPYTISITAPETLKAYANTPLIAERTLGNGMVRHQFAPSKPLPSYLVAIAVGDFTADGVTIPPNTVRERPLELRHIATQGQNERLDFGLRETPEILGLLEDYFGSEYPYEKLDQIASPIMGGAMENAGLITYMDPLLLLDESAPNSQKASFGNVVAHELAHQWFGNLVTPRWWDDIWLNEAFASWMGDKIGHAWDPDLGIDVAQLSGALATMDADSRAVGRPIHQEILRNEEIKATFDGITYQKGGQVLGMFENYLGAENFRAGVRHHIDRFAWGTATAEDFYESIGSVSDDPRIVPAFQSFTSQRGVPLITVTRAGESYRVAQSHFTPIGVERDETSQWIVPLCASNGKNQSCTLLEGTTGELPGFTVIGSDYLHPNAGGDGYYRFALPDEDWDRLIAAAPGLSAREAMAVADSAYAGFVAGATGFEQVLEAAEVLAQHSEAEVATFIPSKLTSLKNRLMSEGDRENYGAYIRSLFADRLAEMGADFARGAYADEDPEASALRQRLVAFMAGSGGDENIRGALATAAAASLDGDADALDPSYEGLAYQAYVQQGGKPAAERLFAAVLESDDSRFRQLGVQALGGIDRPELTPFVLSATEGPGLNSLEKIYTVFSILGAPTTRQATYDYIVENFDTVAEWFSGFGNQIFGVGGGFCSNAAAEEVRADLTPYLESEGGGELDLERSLAAVRECAALKDAVGDQISAALAVQAAGE